MNNLFHIIGNLRAIYLQIFAKLLICCNVLRYCFQEMNLRYAYKVSVSQMKKSKFGKILSRLPINVEICCGISMGLIH
jgi:hypothetical protein